MLVSFIKCGGLRIIFDGLRKFTDAGRLLRIVTTTYLGVTDPGAIVALSGLKNAAVKVAYDDNARTRLHAKLYVFIKEGGKSVAYVGSSNLSGVALTEGIE